MTGAGRNRPSASTWYAWARSSTGPATLSGTTPPPPLPYHRQRRWAARVGQLLDAAPALTAADVTGRLGVHRNTAQAPR
ncbi:hypothetical protein R2F25_00255 [Streptomyces sp. UP1A-1]|nr:hypothetical protein [Streptomyces sp. UP1A-1]